GLGPTRSTPMPVCYRPFSHCASHDNLDATTEERLVPIVLSSNTAEIPFTTRYFARLFSTSANSPDELIRESFRRRGYILLLEALDRTAVLDLRAAYLGKFPDDLFKTGADSSGERFSRTYPPDLPAHGRPGHPAWAFVRSERFRNFVATERLQ